jgi:hypothetical protein
VVAVTIVGPGLSTKNAPITFTIRFDHKVAGLTPGALQIEGGKLADDGFISVEDGVIYRVLVMPARPGPGTVALGIREGAARDPEQVVSAGAQASVEFTGEAPAPAPAPSAPGDHAPVVPAKP